MKFLAEERPRLPQSPTETHKGHSNRAGHHKGEARIPGSRTNGGEIEKVEDLGRIRHAGHQESKTEDQADCKLEDNCHHAHPKCRAINTVTIPAAMKVMVAKGAHREPREPAYAVTGRTAVAPYRTESNEDSG